MSEPEIEGHFKTLGIMCVQYIKGYHEYIKGISREYWGYSVHQRDSMNHVGDIIST